MNIILLIILSFTLLIILQNVIENRTGISDVFNKVNNNSINSHFNKISASRDNATKTIKQRSKQKVEYDHPFYKFPDPMLSTISNPLSPGYSPLNSDNNNLLSNDRLSVLSHYMYSKFFIFIYITFINYYFIDFI